MHAFIPNMLSPTARTYDHAMDLLRKIAEGDLERCLDAVGMTQQFKTSVTLA